MNWNLVLLLVLAHIVADFYLQTDKFCDKKILDGFKGHYLYLHALCVFIVSWAFSFDIGMFVPALVIAVTHLLLDGCKSLVGKRTSKQSNRYGLIVFIVDQLLHLGVILGCVYYFGYCWSPNNCLNQIDIQVLLVCAAVLFLGKPVNILVDLLFKRYTISSEETDEINNFHSGRIIGSLERWLILVLVLLSQYEAIGFLVAAKSILRFGEASQASEKSEYVLVGTLFSFLVALITGVAISQLIK